MKPVQPVTLAAGPIRLVPLTLDHVPGLEAAAADGELWTLRFTSVPGGGPPRRRPGHAPGLLRRAVGAGAGEGAGGGRVVHQAGAGSHAAGLQGRRARQPRRAERADPALHDPGHLAKARYDVLVSSLKLRQASGQLKPEDVAAVNALLAK